MSCDLDTVFENAGPGDLILIKNNTGNYTLFARGPNGAFERCTDSLSQKELCGYMCPSATVGTGKPLAPPIIVDTDVPDPTPEGMPPVDEIRAFADLWKRQTVRLVKRDLRVTPPDLPWTLRGSGGLIREEKLPLLVRELVPPLFRVPR